MANAKARLISADEQQRRATAAAASIHSAALEGQHLAPAAADSASFVRGKRTRQRHGVA